MQLMHHMALGLHDSILLLPPGSDVIHVKALGAHIYVVNGAKAAKELFYGRPQTYNDK